MIPRMASPTPFALRDYQIEAADAVDAALARGVRGPAVVMPTGTGKSIVIGEVARRNVHRGRVLALAHRSELLAQNAEKAKLAGGPRLRVGLVQGARHNAVLADVIMASTATLASEKRRKQIDHVGLIIVDECHHATAPTYRKIAEHYGVPIVGFTATMTRGDRAALGEVWTDVVYQREIAWAIRAGHLAPVRGIRIQVESLDLAKVKRMHGDYSEKALGEALEGSLAPGAVARAYREHAADKQGILFAPTVHSAEVMADALREAGFTVGVIHGKMGDDERGAVLGDFRKGVVQILANCMVLTEGTDLPMAEVAVMCRPTSNVGLYIQCVGRVLRPHPGKERALVLDLVGATAKHTLVSPVQLFGDDVTEVANELLELVCEMCGIVGGHDPGCLLAKPDELEPAAAPDGPDWVDGKLTATEVDLFGSSKAEWHRTADGWWFISAGERFIAIVPSDPGRGLDVVWMHKRLPGPGHSGWVARFVGDLGTAMKHAEDNVNPAEKQFALKERGWRSRPVSASQRRYAGMLGVQLGPFATGGEASLAIDQAEGTRRIDYALRQRITAPRGPRTEEEWHRREEERYA